MSIFSNFVGNVPNLSTVSQMFNKQDVVGSLNKLSDSKIISIATDINNIFSDVNIDNHKSAINLKLSQIIMMGTQSSGKSSALNSIIGMDIAPTGKTMTTRTPIEFNMSKIDKNSQGYIEFGFYDDIGTWNKEQIYNITTPIPLQSEINLIREHISQKTIQICGPGMNINAKPIILNIFSHYVPNLSLIDLPGLTMVACEDKGQPADIRERIEDLVTSYIEQKHSIIIAVMQARSDLETDLGLALVKKYDKNGERTIGVLTKPDLMNYDSHIGDYLINNKISKNLMLNHGYYVLKNRNDKEVLEFDILKGFKMETEYFAAHQEYKKSIYEEKLGIKNLTNNLTKILVSSITDLIPSVMTDIIALDTKITFLLSKMGDELPSTKEGKISVLNKYVTNFNNKFIDSIESRGNPLFNAGKNIKEIFIEFRIKMMKIKPFYDDKYYNQKYFDNVISSFEGNHMSNHTSPIQILEACMADNNLRPIMLLKDLTINCVDNICGVLIDLIRSVLSMEEFAQYPLLPTFVMNNLIDKVISKQKILANEKILDNILAQEAYIWTDEERFLMASEKIRKENVIKIDLLKEFLEAYYTSVKHTIADVVPKIIMQNIIRHVESCTLSYLFENIVTEDKTEYLKEDPNVDKQRKYYHQIKTRIANVKNAIQKNVQYD